MLTEIVVLPATIFRREHGFPLFHFEGYPLTSGLCRKAVPKFDLVVFGDRVLPADMASTLPYGWRILQLW
jgi:hypothetical protein